MGYNRLTSDQIAAIQAAPLTESTAALARRLGIAAKNVAYQRVVFQRKQGANAPKLSGPPVAREFIQAHANAIRIAVNEQMNSEPPARAPRPAAQSVPVWEPEPEVALPRAAKVTLEVPEKTIDAWWAALDLDSKAALFTSNYRFAIEGSVQ